MEDDNILSVLNDEDSTVEESQNPEVEETEQDTVQEVSEQEEDQQEEQVEEQVNEEEDAQLDPKEQARKRYEERQMRNSQRRNQYSNLANEEIEKYVKQGEDEYEQRIRQVEAKNLEMEVQQYFNNVEHNENLLVNEFERTKSDQSLQIFNPESSDFNPKLYDKALRDYNAGYIKYDNNGNIIGLKGSLYEHLKETAELYRGAIKNGAIQQVKATRTMKANADSKPASQPKATQKDAILDILTAE